LIILKVGANKDPSSLNGLAHVFEHYILESVLKEFMAKGIENEIDYYGYTDFDYIFLQFELNSRKFVQDIFYLFINELFNKNIELNEKVLQICKGDVLNELLYRKKSIIKAINKNRYVTGGKIDYHSCGAEAGVKAINLNNIREAFLLINDNITIVRLSDIEIDKSVYNKKLSIVNKKASFIRIIIRSIGFMLKRNKKILSLYFNYKEIISFKIDKLILLLVEDILREKLLLLGMNDICFIKKKYSMELYFYIIRFSCRNKKLIKDTSNYISNIIMSITPCDIEDSIIKIANWIETCVVYDDNYMINNITNYLVYNDLIALSMDQFNEIKKEIKKIHYTNVLHYLNRMFCNNYHMALWHKKELYETV